MPVFLMNGLRLGRRCARGSLIEDQFKMGIDGAGRIQPSYRMWPGQGGAVREVNRYGVSKMADAAMLVFEGLVVPVACRLECKRQHDSRDHNG